MPTHRTVLVSLDLTATFDNVDHEQLLDCVYITNIPAKIRRWLYNFMQNRRAKIYFWRQESKSRKVKTGMVQGGVLSPALFTYYMGDFKTPPPNIRLIKYADDITICTSGPVVADLINLAPSMSSSITIHLKSLHWLPVKVRSTYKIACLCYHCHSSTAPSYVTDMLHKKPLHTRNTRSSSYTMPLLNRPAHSKATLGDRSFSFASSSVWNSIPNDVRCAPLSSLKSRLKTYLFRSVYKD